MSDWMIYERGNMLSTHFLFELIWDAAQRMCTFRLFGSGILFTELQVLHRERTLPCYCSHLFPTVQSPSPHLLPPTLWSSWRLSALGTADSDLSVSTICSSSSSCIISHPLTTPCWCRQLQELVARAGPWRHIPTHADKLRSCRQQRSDVERCNSFCVFIRECFVVYVSIQ